VISSGFSTPVGDELLDAARCVFGHSERSIELRVKGSSRVSQNNCAARV
jgi:hypothetical protein